MTEVFDMPIELDRFLVFMAASLALALTPGPDLLYVAGRSLGQGRLAGVVSAIGVGCGCVVHLTAAAFGLSAILSYSATAFTIVKLIGGLYLIYLGWVTFRSESSEHNPGGRTVRRQRLSRLFWQGTVSNILNPKVAIFFMAFLPQFVDPTRSSAFVQIIFLGSIFVIQGTIVMAAAGLAFGAAGAWLSKHPAFWKWQRRITASLLASLGLRLLLVRND